MICPFSYLRLGSDQCCSYLDLRSCEIDPWFRSWPDRMICSDRMTDNPAEQGMHCCGHGVLQVRQSGMHHFMHYNHRSPSSRYNCVRYIPRDFSDRSQSVPNRITDAEAIGRQSGHDIQRVDCLLDVVWGEGGKSPFCIRLLDCCTDLRCREPEESQSPLH